MLINEGTFKKKNGEMRNMRFVRMGDLPDTFLSARVKGSGNERNLSAGMEVVYDLDADAFRIFNWNTVIGEVRESEENVSLDA